MLGALPTVRQHYMLLFTYPSIGGLVNVTQLRNCPNRTCKTCRFNERISCYTLAAVSAFFWQHHKIGHNLNLQQTLPLRHLKPKKNKQSLCIATVRKDEQTYHVPVAALTEIAQDFLEHLSRSLLQVSPSFTSHERKGKLVHFYNSQDSFAGFGEVMQLSLSIR